LRRLPRKPLNPGYVPPKAYLTGSLTEGADRAPRPDLLGERAAGLGRQFLLEGVPLEAVAQLVRELDAASRLATDGMIARQRLTEMAGRPATARHGLLAQVLAAGSSLVKRPEDMQALAAHLKRAYTLANFARVLMGATELERERAERRQQVRKHRPQR
jgi:hypothetical protein